MGGLLTPRPAPMMATCEKASEDGEVLAIMLVEREWYA